MGVRVPLLAQRKPWQRQGFLLWKRFHPVNSPEKRAFIVLAYRYRQAGGLDVAEQFVGWDRVRSEPVEVRRNT